MEFIINYQQTYQYGNLLGKFSKCFAFLCSLILIAVVGLNEDLSLLIAVVIYLVFLLYVIKYLAERKAFLSPVVLSIFISIGFILKLSVNLAKKHLLFETGWQAIGKFNFSLGEMVGLFVVTICGLYGILVGVTSFETIVNKGRNVIFCKQKTGMLSGFFADTTLIILWFVCYLLLIIIMWQLGLGRHGFAVTPEQMLPFKLVGIMLYLRNMYFVLMAFVIMDILLLKGKTTAIAGVFLLLLLLLIITSIVSFTRGVLMGPVLFFSCFVFSTYREFNLRLTRLCFIFSLIFIIVITSVTIISSMRGSLYSQGLTSGVEVETVLSYISDVELQHVIDRLFTLITSRVEGTRELMAVYSSPLSGFGVFKDAFFNTNTTVYSQIYGILERPQETTQYGVTIGMIGLLFLSKSHFLVFLGSILYTYLFMAIEYIFVKKGYRITAVCCSGNFIVMIWANMVWFFIVRMLVITVLLYLTIIIIEKNNCSLVRVKD